MNENVERFFRKSMNENRIANNLYKTHGVKKGLRNEDGTGVLVGLTRISDVVGYKMVDGKKVDDYGTLYYRGYDIKDLINDSTRTNPNAFEEVCFLILFGYLPERKELEQFQSYLQSKYKLPEDFLEMNILRVPGKNLMNRLQQAVLRLYAYDDNPDDTSVENTLSQGLNILAKIPSIICYIYMSKMNYYHDRSLIIHPTQKNLSIAQNILCMLRDDKHFSPKEAEILDLMLVIHADHGGGNNSTFTNVVISSTGTDIYSAMVGGIGSMKGPRHGGANLRVCEMMEEVKKEIGLTTDKEKVRKLINRILDKDFFDNSGLIYGIGHAVYTKSDPRSEILKQKSLALAVEKGRIKEYEFYMLFEKTAIEIMKERKGINVSSNVDFYSGFVYDMLNIPKDMFTLLFVCARVVGWLAHNIENKLYCDKITRPATQYVGEKHEYVERKERGNEDEEDYII